MLSVGVDDQHVLAGGVPDAGLHGRAVALVVRMPDDARASRCGRVAVSSVDPSSTTSISRQVAAARSDWTTVPIASASSNAGNDDADGGRISHECEIVSWCKLGAKI